MHAKLLGSGDLHVAKKFYKTIEHFERQKKRRESSGSIKNDVLKTSEQCCPKKLSQGSLMQGALEKGNGPRGRMALQRVD